MTEPKKGGDTMDMTGKAVLITGASRGIGAAAAGAFAAAGARVALAARSAEDLSNVVDEVGGEALAIPCDVSRYWEIEAAVAKTVETFGALDVLIGNAGVIGPIATLDAADPEDWARTVDINLKGVMHGMRATLPGMIARGSGTIITVSSGAAHSPLGSWSAYNASKAGAYMLTRAADLENRERGIRVLGLSPGTVATDMQRAIKASGVGPVAQLDWEDHIPPEWPAKALVWMCGPEADDWLGRDVSLREDEVRRAVGLI